MNPVTPRLARPVHAVAAPPRPAAAKPKTVPPMSLLARIPVALIILYLTVAHGIYTGEAFHPSRSSEMYVASNPVSRSVWIISLFLGAWIAMRRLQVAIPVVKRTNLFLFAFYALAMLSVLWSIQPSVTIVRIVPMLAVTFTGLALATGDWHYTNLQRAVRPVLTGLLLGCVAFIFAFPSIGIDPSPLPELHNTWRGLTGQKNTMGSVAAMLFVMALHAWLSREIPRWQSALMLALASLCLFKCRSSTSLLAAMFGSMLLVMLVWHPRGLRRYVPYFIGAFAILILVYALAVLNLVPGLDVLLSPVTAFTGKDLTFTGRTRIWKIINAHIALSPMLGSGYGAYWVPLPGSPSLETLAKLDFYPSEAHNGYLDVINDLGAVGAAILGGYLIVFLRQCLRIYKQGMHQGALYLSVLFMLFVANFSESRWLNILDFTFDITVFASLVMARHLIELDARPATAARPRRFGALRP